MNLLLPFILKEVFVMLCVLQYGFVFVNISCKLFQAVSSSKIFDCLNHLNSEAVSIKERLPCLGLVGFMAKALINFTRCCVDGRPGQPFTPTDEEIKDVYLPMLEGKDIVIMSYTTLTRAYMPQLERDAVLLTAKPDLPRKYLKLSRKPC